MINTLSMDFEESDDELDVEYTHDSNELTITITKQVGHFNYESTVIFLPYAKMLKLKEFLDEQLNS